MSNVIKYFFSGFLLSISAAMAHNFFHQKENWRTKIFDFATYNSSEFRLSHIFSHHPFPNTIYDFEVLAVEPYIQFLPKQNKSWFSRYFCIVNTVLFFFWSFLYYHIVRMILVFQRKIQYYPEDLIVVLQFLVLFLINGSFWNAITWVQNI